VFFVGPRNAGKSMLMGRVLDAAAGQGSGGSSNTSSSSCVSYAYVRPTNSSSGSGSRDHAVAHFWELSSGDTSGSFSQDVAAARALLDADRLFVTPKTVRCVAGRSVFEISCFHRSHVYTFLISSFQPSPL
jgi:hypothetical protein